MKKRNSIGRSRFITPYLYIAPAFITLAVFMYWPLLYNIILSFFQWNFISPVKNFVGWENYKILLSDNVFSRALINTFKYIIGILPFTIIIPLFFAHLVASFAKSKAKRLYETLLFIPTAVSFAVASFVWVWMFNPLGGVIDRFISLFGSTQSIPWLSSATLAPIAVIIVSGWRLLGYYMIIFTAALLTVPAEYTESAYIDGAGAWKTFWYIKWPLISPTTFFVFITTVFFASSQTFIPIHILTRGGPYRASANLMYVVYEYGFRYFNIGLAATTATLTFLIFVLVTFAQIKVSERMVHYDL
ncbi:MAG: sugar ABC transporter permease [Sphaerochaetaceae bacterium]|nr:sugar ABC transporter permease [Sphaerochaetaceae bacterium]MDD3365950.1 sugar ABC transporter permease [Sphaerochaetaceae bacterium]MDD4219638.1 sugar ABC transporter permease [Sphaerochaetaceae bacterium]MDY0372075.1 sugar ABC transporter permease [Sphaerochaetaceae bacterium]